ncbi:MAG: DUF4296 domain-containing protein [Bacteroidales bacterium]|nr:DUF4296 domain-containing protein [Bacteroidales bacterium]MDZ4204558.1 DUF4296 domain-containing protein [Bacteroidales bacterium]
MLFFSLKSRVVTLASIILLLFVFCLACNQEDPLPEYVLDQQKMVEVLVDMQLIEGVLNQQQNVAPDVFNMSQIYYDSLYTKYGISHEILDSSLSYYGRRPKVLEKILEEVITALNKIELDAEQEENKKLSDSSKVGIIVY